MHILSVQRAWFCGVCTIPEYHGFLFGILIRSSSGTVGSSYIMVSALKCVMTYEYGKRPLWGLRLWYQMWNNCYEYYNYVRIVFGCKSCPMKGLLGVIFCMWMGILVSCSFMLDCCSYWPEYFVSGKWGGELFQRGRACYWWWEVGVCDVEGSNNVLKDGTRECVLWKFEGVTFGHYVFVMLV